MQADSISQLDKYLGDEAVKTTKDEKPEEEEPKVGILTKSER